MMKPLVFPTIIHFMQPVLCFFLKHFINDATTSPESIVIAGHSVKLCIKSNRVVSVPKPEPNYYSYSHNEKQVFILFP